MYAFVGIMVANVGLIMSSLEDYWAVGIKGAGTGAAAGAAAGGAEGAIAGAIAGALAALLGLLFSDLWKLLRKEKDEYQP